MNHKLIAIFRQHSPCHFYHRCRPFFGRVWLIRSIEHHEWSPIIWADVLNRKLQLTAQWYLVLVHESPSICYNLSGIKFNCDAFCVRNSQCLFVAFLWAVYLVNFFRIDEALPWIQYLLHHGQCKLRTTLDLLRSSACFFRCHIKAWWRPRPNVPQCFKKQFASDANEMEMILSLWYRPND